MLSARQTLLPHLRTLLLVVALLVQGIVAADHDHDRSPHADGALCPVCIHGANAGAAVETAPATVAVAPPRTPRFTRVATHHVPAHVAHVSIRGPPLPLA